MFLFFLLSCNISFSRFLTISSSLLHSYPPIPLRFPALSRFPAPTPTVSSPPTRICSFFLPCIISFSRFLFCLTTLYSYPPIPLRLLPRSIIPVPTSTVSSLPQPLPVTFYKGQFLESEAVFWYKIEQRTLPLGSPHHSPAVPAPFPPSIKEFDVQIANSHFQGHFCDSKNINIHHELSMSQCYPLISAYDRLTFSFRDWPAILG